MKKLLALSFCGCLAAASTSSAIDLKQSKLTQVVNDVQIISAANQSKKSATVNDLFNMPDILRTGAGSRAELVAADETVTRVGANTIFSFDPANRTIDLKQGSLLFHSPHGKGGGTIHTGSATASVLGTTLIVTTTTNGGMKVIDLEGTVQVNFTNHLKQKLSPGQMTFILPGSEQLAPVINFRLDTLIGVSRLVNGFNQPLASQPLIDKQIHQQTKLITSGRATDTGLSVGENATHDTVDVQPPNLDPNTVQSTVGSTKIGAALAADAPINQSSLADISPPNHVFSDQVFTLPNSAFFGQRHFTGFVAHNIFFNTIGLDPLTVDLSPYASSAEFDIVAGNNLTVSGPVLFSGFSSQNSIFFSLIAGNALLLAAGSSLTADIGNLELSAGGKLTVDASTVHNQIGNTRLTSGSDMLLENGAVVFSFGGVSCSSAGDFTLSHSAITADSILVSPVGGALVVDSSSLNLGHNGVLAAAKDITIHNAVLNASPYYGSISVSSSSGSVNIDSTVIQTHVLTVNSGDGILLDGTGGSLPITGNGSIANLTAVGTADIKNNDFSGFAVPNITAHTINLLNDKFRGTPTLKSEIGQWHNGYASGYVNDLGGNTYNGIPISAADGTTGTLPGTGITISKR